MLYKDRLIDLVLIESLHYIFDRTAPININIGVLCGCILGFAVLRSQIKAKMKVLFDEKQLIAQDSDGKVIDCDLLYDKLLH